MYLLLFYVNVYPMSLWLTENKESESEFELLFASLGKDRGFRQDICVVKQTTVVAKLLHRITFI
jgi:hypothetical protein